MVKGRSQSEKNRRHERTLVGILEDIQSEAMKPVLLEQESLSAVGRSKEDGLANGVFYFDIGNKWMMGVFIDCGEFDYVEGFKHGGTEIINFEDERYYPVLSRSYKQFQEHYRNHRGRLNVFEEQVQRSTGVSPLRM